MWAKLWTFVLGMFSGGGGGIVSAVDDGLKLAGKVADAAHDANERTAGANEVKAETNANAAKVNANVAQAAVSTDPAAAVDLLRRGGA